MTNEAGVIEVTGAVATGAVPSKKARAERTKRDGPKKPKKRTKRAFGGSVMELGQRPGSLFGRYVDPLTGARKTVKLVKGTNEKAWEKAEELLHDIIRDARAKDPESEERRGITLIGFLAEFMAQPTVARPSRAETDDDESRLAWKKYRDARRVANEEAAIGLDVGVLHVEGMRNRLDRAAAYFGSMSMAKIDRVQADDYLVKLAREDARTRVVVVGKKKDGKELTKSVPKRMSKATVTRHRAALSACWARAIERNAATVNPWAASRQKGKKRKTGQKFAPHVLTTDEITRIIARVPEAHRPLFEFLPETGLRLTEALNLTWQRVAPGFARVTVEQSKSGDVRDVPCSIRTRELLATRHAAKVAQFTGPDYVFHHFERSYVWATWQRACIAAGVGRGVRVHDLRHYFGYSHAQVGTPLSTIQKLLGHSTIRMTEIYASHLPNNAPALAIAALDAARGVTVSQQSQATGPSARVGVTS